MSSSPTIIASWTSHCGQESRLCYLGHALMENRNGLVAAAEATLATGTAEREAAAAFSQRLLKGAILGADKGYDAKAFVESLKARGIEPHIAINGTVSKHGKPYQQQHVRAATSRNSRENTVAKGPRKSRNSDAEATRAAPKVLARITPRGR